MNKDIQITANKFYSDSLDRISRVFVRRYPEPLETQTRLQKFIDEPHREHTGKEPTSCAQTQAVPPTPEPLKIKQKVIINTYGHGPWHNATGFVVEALGKGMYKVSVTNLGTTRVLSFHRSELTEVTT